MIKPPSILPKLDAGMCERLGASRCSATALRMVKLLSQPAPYFSVKLWPNHGERGFAVFGRN